MGSMGRLGRGRSLAPFIAVALVAGTSAAAAQAGNRAARRGQDDRHHRGSGCALNQPQSAIKHVIYLQFDNVHLTRDKPRTCRATWSKMPNLLNFLTDNGTVDSNHHTPLIAHTGNDILTSITGLYGSDQGQPVSNSYRYYNPNGITIRPRPSRTGPTASPTRPRPRRATPRRRWSLPQGKMTPAPWVGYTRAGCDFGSVATANTVLENTKIDVPKVFGATSPEAAELAANPSLAYADFVGIGVHCAKDSTLCANSAKRQARPAARRA